MDKRKMLLVFMESAFTVDELRRFLGYEFPEGRDLLPELPGGDGVSLRRYVDEVIGLLERARLLERGFFASLQTFRPRRCEDIEVLRRMYCSPELYEAVGLVRQEEDGLKPQEVELRNSWWDEYEDRVHALSGEERFACQRLNTEIYLAQFGVSVREIKSHLSALGFYTGPLDDEIDHGMIAAFESLQRRHNLRHVDGICGQLTLEKIYQLVGRRS